MRLERSGSRVVAVMSILAAMGGAFACGGDDTGSTPNAGGAAGTGGSEDASAGAGGAAGTSGHVTGVGGGIGGAAPGMVDAAQPDGASDVSETAAPFATQTLFDFTPAEAGGSALGWIPVPGTAGSRLAVVSDDQAPLSPTEGALEFRGVFPPPDQNGSSTMSLEVTFGDPNIGIRDFTGASNFHFWVRVVSSGSVLQTFQPFVQGGALAAYGGTYQPFVETFDDTWHEYITPVSGQFYLSSVWKLGIQFFAVPPPTTPSTDGGVAADDGANGDSGALAEASVPVDAAIETGAGGDVSVPADAERDAASQSDAALEAETGTQDTNAARAFVVHIDYVWVN